MKPILTWYWLGGSQVLNFGEHFVELLLPHLGFTPRSFDVELRAGSIVRGEPCLLIVGSEFHKHNVERILDAGCQVHVWGQGNGRGAHTAIDMREAKYEGRVFVHALRGPLTKRVSHFEGDVPLLDPGFLMPRFYPLPTAGDGGVLYFPHHNNTVIVQPATLERIGAKSLIRAMIYRADVQATMARVAAAEFALVNAMHAFIFCLAYRVPCAICLTEGETFNMPDKWRDVLESLGWSGDKLPLTANLDEGRRWWESEGQHLTIPDVQPLLDAFPFQGDS